MCGSTRKRVWIFQQDVQKPTLKLSVETEALEAGIELEAGEAEELRGA